MVHFLENLLVGTRDDRDAKSVNLLTGGDEAGVHEGDEIATALLSGGLDEKRPGAGVKQGKLAENVGAREGVGGGALKDGPFGFGAFALVHASFGFGDVDTGFDVDVGAAKLALEANSEAYKDESEDEDCRAGGPEDNVTVFMLHMVSIPRISLFDYLSARIAISFFRLRRSFSMLAASCLAFL